MLTVNRQDKKKGNCTFLQFYKIYSGRINKNITQMDNPSALHICGTVHVIPVKHLYSKIQAHTLLTWSGCAQVDDLPRFNKNKKKRINAQRWQQCKAFSLSHLTIFDTLGLECSTSQQVSHTGHKQRCQKPLYFQPSLSMRTLKP